MLAILSLTTLMARRATGVSANLRRFAGVGLGVAFWPARPGLYGLRMEGSIAVFLSPLVASPAVASIPTSLCHASVTLVRSPTLVLLSNLCWCKRKWHSRFRCAFRQMLNTDQ